MPHSRRTTLFLSTIATVVALTSCTPLTPIGLPGDPAQAPTIEQVVNATAPDHSYNNYDVPMRVYRLVAAERGWDTARIEAWAPFVRRVIGRESGGCYNLRRGPVFAFYDGRGCLLARQGRHTDSGYGQVLMSIHTQWLCPQEGLCSPDAVVATPYSSMTAFVALLERGGKQPWCYTAKLRAGAVCRSAP